MSPDFIWPRGEGSVLHGTWATSGTDQVMFGVLSIHSEFSR
jgi:hypothetical protein